MPWSASSPPTWNVTDNELVLSAQYRLLEAKAGSDSDGTFVTPQFTVVQLIAALNDRQRQFLLATGMSVARVTQGVTPGTGRYALPSDWIDTRRITYQPIAGSITSLQRSDPWEFDHSLLDWQYNTADPTYYQEATLPTATVEVVKAPVNGGTLSLIYTLLGVVLDGTGVKLTIPDEFAPFVMYGAIGDLLSQNGEGQDSERAAFCLQFYDLGVELGKLMLGGVTTPQQGGQA